MSETEFTFSLDGTPYLEFLPVVDLSSGRLLGMEALVRWQHPTEGVIAPGQLIPQAEASGDIMSLTRWVLTESCRQACTWSPSIQLGVNCSIHQLRRGEVSKAVEDALERTSLPSGQLTLEVTEEAIVDSSASGDLKDLSHMGVQLSVDDVGTNWSSFEPFKRHSISTVKIDGSFISGLESTQGINRLVVETVIHMAHSLGMSAIVEQVETQAQLEIVRSFQADAAQGFFFARPMSSEDAAGLAQTDDVPHFSRTSERTLLRRVGGTTVEEAFGSHPGAAATAVAEREADDGATSGMSGGGEAGEDEPVAEGPDEPAGDETADLADDADVATGEGDGDEVGPDVPPEERADGEVTLDTDPDDGSPVARAPAARRGPETAEEPLDPVGLDPRRAPHAISFGRIPADVLRPRG